MPLPEANFVPQFVASSFKFGGPRPTNLSFFPFFFSSINCTRAHFIVGELGQLGFGSLLLSSPPLSCAPEEVYADYGSRGEKIFFPLDERCLLPPVVTFYHT